MAKNSPNKNFDRAVITAMVMLLLFASPITDWWAGSNMPWYLPYVLWLLIILLTALAHWRDPDR